MKCKRCGKTTEDDFRWCSSDCSRYAIDALVELYEALERLWQESYGAGAPSVDAMEQAMHALAKARGEES